eukprot:CAMPEP_0170374066 /NCGR_PEP_ID=MMETSP0117_2-20130122/10405_1 /TAXON_ID=400756 /ORGANISM="Durinskia baltica, Strain CSIRO CS-38" /LENGTH=881 /DNA_ID=CAMNT_0010629001 /DNA_START=104 /DNA_END=2749 /DNA_ORIENTATION=+
MSTTTAETICPICRVSPEDPVNFCEDQTHEKCCKECISSYIQSTVNSAFLGSCPIIACPSACHQSGGKKKKKILRFKDWASQTPPEISKRYGELASSLLAFLCGGCHSLKTLDLGFESDKADGSSFQHLDQYFNNEENNSTMQILLETIQIFCSGSLTVEETYAALLKDSFPNLITMPDATAWELFSKVLRIIPDPERRVNLHLRYLRDRPRIKTLCCNREHCFRCKVKDFHEGKTCMESSVELDHSVVNCPTCGIALAKGDGCNTITCVCGKQFSWTAEKENIDRCQQFMQAYPENTSARCVHILCTEMATTGSGMQQAHAWQARNRQEVTRCLQQWFCEKYWPCPSQACAILPLEKLPDGVRQAVEIWKTYRPREVSKCVTQRDIAMHDMFTIMYRDPTSRAMAAQRIVSEHRRLKDRNTNMRDDPQLLAMSATDWIERNPVEYRDGIEAAELALAKQFLFLFGKRKMHSTKPSYVNCPYSFEWCREISNDDLLYTNQNTSVTRPGSVSCYPAAFSRLVGDHSMFRVSIDAAPRSSNWLTFGIARMGMATTSSDGVGRTTNSWGVADDRSSNSLPVVSASGTNVGQFRKFVVGDVLSAEVDTSAGWFEIRLNENEYVHRFEIPTGSMDEYVFAMTFANDHQVTIQCDDAPPTAATARSADMCIHDGAMMNFEHTQMYNAFKKHMKLLLAETESIPDSAGRKAAALVASTTVPSTIRESSLKVPASQWVELCGGQEMAANYFEVIRSEIHAMSKSGREYPWKEPSKLPWLTWEHLLWAASWFSDNRIALKDARDSELAYTFSLAHGADAPFIAAVNLCDFHQHSVDREDLLASLAYMRFYQEDMNEWYDYDSKSREPMVENVAKGCRCLPRHIKKCPHRK